MIALNFALIIFYCFCQFFDLISSKNDSKSSTGSIPKKRLKILVHDPSLGFSHSQFLGAIADTLQEAGHEVVRLFLLKLFKLKKNILPSLDKLIF